MKEFLVLSFSGQVGSDGFEYGFVSAEDEEAAYEKIYEEGVGYPGSFVNNCLIALNKENIQRLKQMVKEAGGKQR